MAAWHVLQGDFTPTGPLSKTAMRGSTVIQQCDVYAGLHGGPGCWIDVPVYMLGRTCAPYEVNRLERKFIARLGVLNRMHCHRVHGLQSVLRGSKRGRPIRSLRGLPKGTTTAVGMPARPTEYRLTGGFTSLDFTSVLRYLKLCSRVPNVARAHVVSVCARRARCVTSTLHTITRLKH